MKINVTVDITTDEQLKEQAVAMAQAVVNTAIAKAQGCKPGGIKTVYVAKEDIERVSKNLNATIPTMENIPDPPPPVKCPECGGLYGAHREECSKGTKPFNAAYPYKIKIEGLEKEIEKLRGEARTLQTRITIAHEGQVAFARRFVEWLQINPNWSYSKVRERFEEFLNTLPSAS